MFQGFKKATPYGGARKLRLTPPPVCSAGQTSHDSASKYVMESNCLDFCDIAHVKLGFIWLQKIYIRPILEKFCLKQQHRTMSSQNEHTCTMAKQTMQICPSFIRSVTIHNNNDPHEYNQRVVLHNLGHRRGFSRSLVDDQEQGQQNFFKNREKLKI